MLKALIAAVRAPVKTTAAVLKTLKPAEQPRSRDPWYSDLERQAEINARASGDGRSWIPRRPGWLSSRGKRW
jgi:hypothetical protein